jgi:hypothetical protein
MVQCRVRSSCYETFYSAISMFVLPVREKSFLIRCTRNHIWTTAVLLSYPQYV